MRAPSATLPPGTTDASTRSGNFQYEWRPWSESAGVAMPASSRSSVAQAVGRVATAGHDGIELVKLAAGDRTLQFGHPVVQRGEVVVGSRIAVAPGLVDEQEQAARELVVVGADDAAFPGGDVLALLQREGRDAAEGAHLARSPGGAERLGRVLDHGQIVPLREREDVVELAGLAEQMRHDDGARALGVLGARCCSAVTLSVSGSTSAKTGTAPS